jgi:tellurite resistance-related uncharacterized protein
MRRLLILAVLSVSVLTGCGGGSGPANVATRHTIPGDVWNYEISGGSIEDYKTVGFIKGDVTFTVVPYYHHDEAMIHATGTIYINDNIPQVIDETFIITSETGVFMTSTVPAGVFECYSIDTEGSFAGMAGTVHKHVSIDYGVPVFMQFYIPGTQERKFNLTLKDYTLKG